MKQLRDFVEPKDIDTSEHYWELFGKQEPEHNARVYVFKSQAKGQWIKTTDFDSSCPDGSFDKDSNLPSNWFLGQLAKFIK